MTKLGIVASMKDFYWDIRPKPEYGTVEIRVCDTPLTIETAVALAFYARTLAKYCFDNQLQPTAETYLTYSYNRFHACRFGLKGLLVSPISNEQKSIQDDVLATIELLHDTAEQLGTSEALTYIRNRVLANQSDSDWLRDTYKTSGSLSEVVRQQSELWMKAELRPNVVDERDSVLTLC